MAEASQPGEGKLAWAPSVSKKAKEAGLALASQSHDWGTPSLNPSGPEGRLPLAETKDLETIWIVPIAPHGIPLLVAPGVLSGRGRAGAAKREGQKPAPS